jgi:hypothetical protein
VSLHYADGISGSTSGKQGLCRSALPRAKAVLTADFADYADVVSFFLKNREIICANLCNLRFFFIPAHAEIQSAW